MNTIFQIVCKLKNTIFFSIFNFIHLVQSVRWENNNLPSTKILTNST